MATITARGLLDHQFRYLEPQNYPGLTKRLEKGAVPVRILHRYDETPPGGRKAGHKPHVRCGFGHLHWVGYVIEDEDGRIALIGQNCAREHFGDEVINRIEDHFYGEKDRQYQATRLISIRLTLPAALAELSEIAQDTRFDDFWRNLTHCHGNASQQLAASVRSSQGTLMGSKKERNHESEAREARRANKVLFEDYDAAETEEERRRAAGRIKKFINSRPPIYKYVEFPMGACDGWRLLDGSKCPQFRKVLAEAISCLQGADHQKPVEEWLKADFARLRRELDKAFEKIETAKSAIADLILFTSSANRERIADWAFQGGLDIEVTPPSGLQWPETPALDALQSARSDRETRPTEKAA